MKKFLMIGAAILWLMAVPAHADGAVWGTVGGYAGADGYRANFDPSLQVAPRDVFELNRAGKPVGQVMLLMIKNEGYVVMGLQDAKPKTGDQLVFVKHADVPNTTAEGPMPSGSAQSVVVDGRKDPNWMKTGYFVQQAAQYGYGNYNCSYPVGGCDAFSAGALHYPGTYGANTYGMHAAGAAAAAGFRR